MRRPSLPSFLLLLLASAPAWSQIGNPAGMMPATPLAAPGQPAPHTSNVPDRLFAQLMTAGGMAEVEAAKLAGSRASNADVKALAQQMVHDHAGANERLAALARQGNIPLPNAPHPDHRAMQAQLQQLDGAQFDVAYLQGQLADHQKTAALLEWEISNGQDAELQRLAASTLPTVLEHLAEVKGLLGTMTGAAVDGVVPVRRGH